jgi:hypothetical protein
MKMHPYEFGKSIPRRGNNRWKDLEENEHFFSE